MSDPRPDLGTVLLGVGELVAPLLDWADGQRADLLRRGWGDRESQRIASEMLLGMLRKVLP